MGQSGSRNAAIEWVRIKREDLESKVQELNEKCSQCFDQNQLNMLFAVKYNENNDFWQAAVRIYCFTALDGKAYRKSYNLYQFLKFYRSFVQILEASQASTAGDPANPTNHEDFMKISIFNETCCVEDGRCIICFDRHPDSVLPCTHAYCSSCIDNFQQIDQSCPLCRHPLRGDEAWVVTEKPSKESINLYLVQPRQQDASTESDND